MRTFFKTILGTALLLNPILAQAFFPCPSRGSSLSLDCLTTIFRAPNSSDNLASIERSLAVDISNNFYEIHNATLFQYDTAVHPWYDIRWSLDKGMIAARYLDPVFKGLETFNERLAYVDRRPLDEIVQGGSNEAVNQLSPAEKYDLLVGDLDSTLSNRMWNIGTSQRDHGGIGHWMGLCEGTAGSTMMLPEPKHPVVLRDARYGRSLTFEASDIKALASLLFSEISLNVPIVGGRCNSSSLDNSPSCESLNPAAWFRALHVIMGIHHDRMFIDVTPTLEVWNSPITSYRTKFYNVLSRRTHENLDEVMVAYSDYKSQDNYSHKRHPNTQYIVGVQTEVIIPAGYTTTTRGINPAKLIKKNYQYDLELDGLGTLLGGEWLSTHPDFLWALKKGFRPKTSADRIIGEEWDGGEVPQSWTGILRQSSRKGQPMGSIVYWLLGESI